MPSRSSLPVVLLLVLGLAHPAAAQMDRLQDYVATAPAVKPLPGEAAHLEPGSANPHLAILPPGEKPAWVHWNARARDVAQGRRAVDPGLRGALPTVRYSEAEVGEGANDLFSTGEFVRFLGTGNGDRPRAFVTGSSPAVPETPIGPFAEDDGAIPLANPTGLVSGARVRVSGVVGDGPHGSAGGNTGDFDFFAVTGLSAGQTILVDVDTPDPFGDLDSFVALWHSSGGLVAFNDDDGTTFDSRLLVQVPVAGDYFVSIGGFGSFITEDPFDPASGFAPGSEGEYEATIGLDDVGVDVYTFDLEAGDAVGVTVTGGALAVRLLDPAGVRLVGSIGTDLSFIYAFNTLLPGGGNASVAQVANFDGRYGIEVTTDGDYAADVRVFRPGLSEVPSRAEQVLFIDFDGAVVDTSIYGLPPSIPQPRTLSPLSAFLPRWGLTAADEDAVIDAILAVVEENLSADLRVHGLNGDRDVSGTPTELDVEILNSRDHADPFGQPNVSRVIVGGTIAESAIGTIGIAQSIDIGNFDRQETALMLLDILSEPNPPNASLFFLNNIQLAPGASIIDLIGVAVGNIVSHEAGHFLSSFHTFQFNAANQIMDQGGNPAGTFGLGPDLIFGTADDEDVDFGVDVYAPNEGLTGLEDTLNATAFGMSTGRRAGGN